LTGAKPPAFSANHIADTSKIKHQSITTQTTTNNTRKTKIFTN